MGEQLINYLKAFLSEQRVQRMEEVLSRRTEYLTVVLEDLHYSQNSSAVIRHCEAFGIQNLHVIENRNKFKLKNHAVRGTLKWIDLHQHNAKRNNSLEAIDGLRAKGYRIVATAPSKEGVTPAKFDICKGPAALFFGNERDGLSEEVLKNADEFLTIPMEGFVESLNISASCAIILQELGDRLRNSDLNWQLQKSRKEELLVKWMMESIKKIDSIMSAYKTI